jgi:hypothetical protein
MDPAEANRRLTESVLTGQNLSAPTLQLLNRAGLAEKFKSQPTEVISAIHKGVPFVQCVVFISTPHRGSFRVGGRAGGLLRLLISLPSTLLSPLQEVIERNPEAVSTRALKGEIPRSTDNMDPAD